MKVAIISEGTYPHQFGGVSVWCDQLIRGLPEHEFTVVAIMATGVEPQVWQLPKNVASVVKLPLWGWPSTGPVGGRRADPRFLLLVSRLVDALVDPSDEAQRLFSDIMHEMFEYAKDRDLTSSFTTQDVVETLCAAWQDRPPFVGEQSPTLRDALTAMQLLEHSLRPFSHAPVEVDVVHAACNGLSILPALTAKWQYGTPVILSEHGIYLREQYLCQRQAEYRWPVKSLYLSFLRRLCMLGYAEADLITSCNIYNRRWEERLGAAPERIRTVYNGVDPANFPALTGEPEEPAMTWVGRIDPIKDLETLLRAFALVQEELPEARLRIFGAPPKGRESYLERCQALAHGLGIAETATFEGHISNPRDAHDRGRIAVLSSVSEGFPYTLIESMICGRTCVATDVGGVSEAVGDTGFVVPPRRPELMAEACLKLLRDTSLRHRLGTAARLRALELFTVDGAISRFDEIYSFLGSGHMLPAAPPEPEADNAADTSLAEELAS